MVQPIGYLIHENGGNFCLRRAHAISKLLEDEALSFDPPTTQSANDPKKRSPKSMKPALAGKAGEELRNWLSVRASDRLTVS
ncbi:hypothetical protein, partial [Mesorhizobium sp. M1A.F.Ca.IN.020.03.1.1]|uniref:hypothetical protein n=1 Tax=Mesorhizobium sp. M1A.F.Ca.IN.020.03.1.1 TaxID=2496764 RepID=UPI0019D2EC53